MPEPIIIPIPPGCGDHAYNCNRTATHWLIHPDGSCNPGGWVCRECGERIIAEYQEKLGETWTLAPIVRECDCRHNTMVERPGDTDHAWECEDCGHVYGT